MTFYAYSFEKLKLVQMLYIKSFKLTCTWFCNLFTFNKPNKRLKKWSDQSFMIRLRLFNLLTEYITRLLAYIVWSVFRDGNNKRIMEVNIQQMDIRHSFRLITFIFYFDAHTWWMSWKQVIFPIFFLYVTRNL